MPDSGSCTCSNWAVAESLPLHCSHGVCNGTAHCLNVGEAASCSAPVPVTETCNGADDNCNGVIDDGTDICSDGNPCTQDHCNAIGPGCSHKNTSGAKCDDGFACTGNDKCAGGVCKGWPNALCDDGNACTTETCEVGLGCVATSVTCDDANICTSDACDPKGGCTTAPLVGACDDGDACTIGDVCKNGGCFVQILSCDDGLACTDDFCSSGAGCFHVLAASCDDGNTCTSDTCDGAGCSHSSALGPCADGNACTSGDVCDGGICQPGKVLLCNDGELCTNDLCDAVKGCVSVALADGTSCTDACGSADVCAGGTCTGAAPIGKINILSEGYLWVGVAAIDDGFVLAGNVTPTVQADMPLVLARLDGQGKLLWTKTLAAPALTVAAAVTVTGDDVLVLANDAQLSAVVTRVDGTTGAVQWQHSWPQAGYADAIAALSDGFVVAGQHDSNGWLLRADASGQAKWAQEYNAGGLDGFAAVTALPDGGILAGGNTEAALHALWLVRTDASGALVWQKTFNLTAQAAHHLDALLSDGAVFFVTSTTNDAYGKPSAHLFKFALDGTQLLDSVYPWGFGRTSIVPFGGDLLVAESSDLKRVTKDGTSVWSRVYVDWDNAPNAADVGPIQGVAANANRILYFGTAKVAIADAWGEISCPDSVACLAQAATDCSDGNSLTLDSCDTDHGGCWHVLASAPTTTCDDANWCTADFFDDSGACAHTGIHEGYVCGGDWPWKGHCLSGVCVGANDDGNPCTVNVPGAAKPAMPDGTTCGCGLTCEAGVCGDATRWIGLLGAIEPLWYHAYVVKTDGLLTFTSAGSDKEIAWFDWSGKQVGQTPLPAFANWFWRASCTTSTGYAIDVSVNGVREIWLNDAIGQLIAKHQADPWQMDGLRPDGLQRTADGVIVPGSVGGNLTLTELDGQANVLWQKAYPLPANATPEHLVVLSDGYAVGVSLPAGYEIVRMNQSGDLLWTVPVVGVVEMWGDSGPLVAAGDDILVLPVETVPPSCNVRVLRVNAKGVTVADTLVPTGCATLASATRVPGGLLLTGGSVYVYQPDTVWRLDAWGNLLWTAGWPQSAEHFPDPRAIADGFLFVDTWDRLLRTDPWLNSSCATSGPCLGKNHEGCSDGNPCTADRCDATHFGCWHAPLPEGAICGLGQWCESGVCKSQ